MGLFSKLPISETTEAAIVWDMTPDLAFCTFTAKGLREDLTNSRERVCYFFIDNWAAEPKLYLMERGVRFVNILAEVKAPQSLLLECITRQGGTASSRNNYPIDDILKDWLLCEVVTVEDSPYLVPVKEEPEEDEEMGKLPPAHSSWKKETCVLLPQQKKNISDEEITPLIKDWDFFESERNPQGNFINQLTDPGDGLTVIDERTGIMWQRSGLDLCSIRSMKKGIAKINDQQFGGYSDWRMPTLEEALSLMEPIAGLKGGHLDPCFSKEQPFIFVEARRNPTGYWFVDYKQGKVYWSSGTVPGGFCRLCRRIA